MYKHQRGFAMGYVVWLPGFQIPSRRSKTGFLIDMKDNLPNVADNTSDAGRWTLQGADRWCKILYDLEYVAIIVPVYNWADKQKV